MSISLASDKVTMSYCHLYFSSQWLNMSPNPLWNWVGNDYHSLASERLSMLIGKDYGDSYTYGGKGLHVTMHHNWFGPNLNGRPLMRGFVHLYNNYFDNTPDPHSTTITQYNANQIGSGSIIYSEGNYFYKTNNSNQVGLDDNVHTAHSFYERNNYYNSTTGTSVTGTAYPNGTNFGYGYSAEPVGSVPNDVQLNAGVK